MATVGLKGGPGPATDDRVAQLDALYRVEYAGMVRLAYTLLGSNAEAEEIVQDSLLEVYRRWHEIRKPGAYLRCTVVSRCRSALQRRKMRTWPSDEELCVSDHASELWDVLTRLSHEQRMAVVLRYYGGLSVAEVADTFATRPEVVQAQTTTALFDLRRLITLARHRART